MYEQHELGTVNSFPGMDQEIILDPGANKWSYYPMFRLTHATQATHARSAAQKRCYHLVMTNISMENHHAIQFGKSISMGHLFHMANC